MSMPLIDNGLLYRKYDETVHAGMRLGRNLWLDARSIPYMIEQRAATWAPLKNQNWERIIPILDQGHLGSCCGNAGVGSLGTEPFYNKCGKQAFGAASDATALETFAVTLYSEATAVDPYPGTYPPTDTGTSALAISKVLRNRRTITSYNWARTAHGFAQLLQWGPVMLGTPWYQAFFTPDAAGFIDSDPNWASSGIAGGHEISVVGIDLDTKDLGNSVVTCVNSWSTNWGDAGRFRFRMRLYDQLHSVDLLQFGT